MEYEEEFESAEDKKARKNLRNVLVQVLAPYHGNEPDKLIDACKLVEKYVLSN